MKEYLDTLMLLLSLTCTVYFEYFLQGGGQGESTLITERAIKVIHINSPDHGTSKAVLLKPLSLVKKKEQQVSLGFLGLKVRTQSIQGTDFTLI